MHDKADFIQGGRGDHRDGRLRGGCGEIALNTKCAVGRREGVAQEQAGGGAGAVGGNRGEEAPRARKGSGQTQRTGSG